MGRIPVRQKKRKMRGDIRNRTWVSMERTSSSALREDKRGPV